MNDLFRDVKDRIRKLDAVLADGGNANAELAQAISLVRRLVNKGDRNRAPSPEILRSLERAEALGRSARA